MISGKNRKILFLKKIFHFKIHIFQVSPLNPAGSVGSVSSVSGITPTGMLSATLAAPLAIHPLQSQDSILNSEQNNHML